MYRIPKNYEELEATDVLLQSKIDEINLNDIYTLKERARVQAPRPRTPRIPTLPTIPVPRIPNTPSLPRLPATSPVTRPGWVIPPVNRPDSPSHRPTAPNGYNPRSPTAPVGYNPNITPRSPTTPTGYNPRSPTTPTGHNPRSPTTPTGHNPNNPTPTAPRTVNPAPRSNPNPRGKEPDPKDAFPQFSDSKIRDIRRNDAKLKQYENNNLSEKDVTNFIKRNPSKFSSFFPNKKVIKAKDVQNLIVKLGKLGFNGVKLLGSAAYMCISNITVCGPIIAASTAAIMIAQQMSENRCASVKKQAADKGIDCDDDCDDECEENIIRHEVVQQRARLGGAKNLVYCKTNIIGLKGLDIHETHNVIYTLQGESDLPSVLTKLNNAGIFPGPETEEVWTGGPEWTDNALYTEYMVNKRSKWKTIAITEEIIDYDTSKMDTEIIYTDGVSTCNYDLTHTPFKPTIFDNSASLFIAVLALGAAAVFID